ncbi:CHAT domain-containing protein [Sphingomonas beigongshangi]|uniref:CHAT domain-containing protein n=1 Tax=Sphingomonas beigongshangi TaxID=2782540 RepID=UPI001AEE24A9|nr:CHAT domain-containing protein [Sphingomonas beigongshangi]
MFPATSAAYPHLVDWDRSFDWIDFASRQVALGLVDEQIDIYRQGGDVAVERYCDVIARDVGDMAADPPAVDDENADAVIAVSEEETVAQTIDAFRLLFSIGPMTRAMSLGRAGDAYGWIMWSIARGAVRGETRFHFIPRIIPQDWFAAADFQELVLERLGGWMEPFYMCARKLGGLDEIARLCAPLCFVICSRQFDAGHNEEENFSALISLANWASNADEAEAERFVHFVSGFWPAPLTDRNRVELSTLLITRAHRFTLMGVQWWANKVLAEFRPLLVEHLEVQFLAASLQDMDDWRERRDEILQAIGQLGRLYAGADDPTRSAQQALESRVNILHPLIFFLTEHGVSEDLLDVLGAWYVASGRRECDGNVLVVAAGHTDGVRYLWPGGMLQIQEGGGSAGYDRILETASNALREVYRSTALGDRPAGFDLNRRGIPDEAAAKPFEDAVRSFYRPDKLAPALPPGSNFRSVVTIPATPIPISAMLASEAGVVAAAEVSLRATLPPRPIRRVSVWSDSMMHGGFEVEALRRASEIAGWSIDVTEGTNDVAAFRAFYADPEADLLWVIGHGTHSAYRIDESGLHLGYDGFLSTADLSSIPVPVDGSRLLVLNVCSGATAQLHGGIARMGLSQELVSPSQQVVAHLWPVAIFGGLAFGASFALELSRRDRASAYAATVNGLKNPSALRQELIEALGGDLEIHARLENQDAQIGSVLSWGAPVLLT